MPFDALETDPRFWVLSEALASYAGDEDGPPSRDGDVLQAAVALVLRGTPGLELLLIKRARFEGDPWSGHMALPGGRLDPEDESLAVTSRRETREEVGLDLVREGTPLGRLDDVAPSSPGLPSLTISPFVYGVGPSAHAHVASPEVAQVYWVSMDELRAPETHSTVEIALPRGTRDFPCYRVAGEVVWGLTYRVLEQFLELFPELELDRLRYGIERRG